MLPDIGANEFGAVVLTATGSAAVGGTLTVQLQSEPAILGLLALLIPGAPVVVPPFGALHGTDPVAIVIGPLPATLNLPIPANLVADIALQGFVLGAAGVSLTNPLAFAIR